MPSPTTVAMHSVCGKRPVSSLSILLMIMLTFYGAVQYAYAKSEVIDINNDDLNERKIVNTNNDNGMLPPSNMNYMEYFNWKLNGNQIPKCGVSYFNNTNYKWENNKPTYFGQYPWTIAFIFNDLYQTLIIGCGALIHPKVVLTSYLSMRFELIHNVTAHAGEWDLYTNTERVGDQNREIREIVTHKQKTEDRDKNALAIVFLRSAFVLSKYVATICLPPQDYKFVPGENCNSCAWQSDESLFNRHTRFNILKNINLEITNRFDCFEALEKQKQVIEFNYDDGYICATSKGANTTCDKIIGHKLYPSQVFVKGDHGAPLMCEIDGETKRYQLAGIAAWRVNCDDSIIPGLFVDVAQFRDWIDQKMTIRNLSLAYYEY